MVSAADVGCGTRGISFPDGEKRNILLTPAGEMMYNVCCLHVSCGLRVRGDHLVIHHTPCGAEEDRALIEVKNLTMRYGKVTALDGVSFKVRNGHVYGLLGPNGAGKSTTMNIITGCLTPTKGTVLVNGYDVSRQPIEAKRQMGYLPEIPPLFPDMTPYEYLCFVAEVKGVDGETRARQVHEVMIETDLVGVQDRLIRHLSKGYKQRVGIAQAMLGDPDIIILDEPTVGLDPKQITDIRALIKRLGKKKTVIVSSHILAEISALCDCVIILNKGRVVADDTVEAVAEGNRGERADRPNVIRLTVRGDENGAMAVLKGLTGVQNVTAEPAGEAGLTDFTVTADAAKDLRDDIFFAMAAQRYAVVSMEREGHTLEQSFLHLTADEREEEN